MLVVLCFFVCGVLMSQEKETFKYEVNLHICLLKELPVHISHQTLVGSGGGALMRELGGGEKCKCTSA